MIIQNCCTQQHATHRVTFLLLWHVVRSKAKSPDTRNEGRSVETPNKQNNNCQINSHPELQSEWTKLSKNKKGAPFLYLESLNILQWQEQHAALWAARLNSAIAWNGAGQDAGLPGIRRVTWGVGETCTNCLVGWPKEGDVLYYSTAVLVITRNMKCQVCETSEHNRWKVKNDWCHMNGR